MDCPPHASPSLGELAQRINHDFRTPLGTLATALDLLRGPRTGDAVVDAETRELMERQVTRLGALIDEFQGLADELTRRGM